MYITYLPVCHETNSRSKVWIHLFLTSALDENDLSALRPELCDTGTHWVGGWLAPRNGSNILDKDRLVSAKIRGPGRLSIAWRAQEINKNKNKNKNKVSRSLTLGT
jgi:hypothetical protein